MLRATDASFMIHVFGHRVQQASCCSASGLHIRTSAFTFEQALYLLNCSFVCLYFGSRVIRVDIAKHLHKEAHGVKLLNLTFRKRTHPVDKFVPLRNGDAQLFFTACESKRVVRNLDDAGSAIQGDCQGVVIDHSHCGRSCCGSKDAVTGSGQQQIAVDLIVTLEGRGLPSTG